MMKKKTILLQGDKQLQLHNKLTYVATRVQIRWKREFLENSKKYL